MQAVRSRRAPRSHRPGSRKRPSPVDASGASRQTSTRCAACLSTTSGYTGGRSANPTYEQVSRGGTGHVEAVEIVFDPAVVSYEQLLDHFWRNVDPFVAHRQFCDVGDQYRPEIFVHSDAQRAAAEASRQRVQSRFKQPIVVKVTPASHLLSGGGVPPGLPQHALGPVPLLPLDMWT